MAAVALLIACAAATAAARPGLTESRIELARPIDLVVRTRDGGSLQGTLVAWSDESIWLSPTAAVGGSAPVEAERILHWSELDGSQAFEIRRRLINPRDGLAWAELGVCMLRSGEVNLAERAFGVAAVQTDERLAAACEEALRLVRSGGDPGTSLEALREARREQALDGRAPVDGAAASAPVPWPVLTQAQLAMETERLKRDAQEKLARVLLTIDPLETDHFLLYTDLPADEARRWSRRLDRMYAKLLEILAMPRDARLFNGKCVIFVFADRGRFVEFESAAFGFAARRVAGVCHQRGPDVFVSFYRMEDETRFISVLVHETVHAFMYRYRTPVNLPTWANEGLADYVAAHVNPKSREQEDHWLQARRFVESGGDVCEIMRQDYSDGTWFTKDSYPVSHMLVHYMLRDRPEAFRKWIDDVKSGAHGGDWRASLEDCFGVDPQRLADGFRRAMLTEQSWRR